MNYKFNETDLDLLGVTDSIVRSILLKTTIVGTFTPIHNYYSCYNLSTILEYGGCEIKINSQYYDNECVYISKKQEGVLNISYYDYNDTLNFSASLGQVNGYRSYNYVCSSMGLKSSINSSTTISDMIDIKVLGKCSICGIIYDGDSTISYNNNSITIQVYDESGLNVLGHNGVKRIKYNDTYVKTLSLNGVIHNLDRSVLYGTFKLPKIMTIGDPYTDGKEHIVVLKDVTNNKYLLYISSKGFGYYNGKLYPKEKSNKISSSISHHKYVVPIEVSDTGFWEFLNANAGNTELSDDLYIILSNDDIYTFTTTTNVSSEIYFNQNINE